MNLCECGCGQECNNRYVHGHHLRKRAPVLEPAVVEAVMEQAAHTPPPWPMPFDRRLFRLAAEKNGTLKTDPWQSIPCASCHEVCWTREQKIEYGEILCEDCLWALSEELGQKQVAQNRTIARAPFDPFR